MDDLLREAIADAKAVRETALENAKIALEEAFTPRLQSMLSKKIASEIEDKDEEDTEERSASSMSEIDKDEEDAEERSASKMSEIDKDEIDKEEEMDEIDKDEIDKEEEMDEIDKDEIDKDEIESTKDHDEIDKDEMKMDSDEIDKDETEDAEDIAMNDEMEEDDLDLESVLAELEADLNEEDKEEEDKVDEIDKSDKEEEDKVDENDVSSQIGSADNKVNPEANDSTKTGAQGPEGEGSDKKAGTELGDHEIVKEMEDKDEEDKEENDLDLDEVLRALTEEDKEEEDKEENEKLKKEIKEHRKVIHFMRSKLNEVNLLNAKLLFSNKLFRAFGLNNNQKLKVVETFDRTKNLREVKLVYATLAESFKRPGKRISESVKRGSSSKPVRSTKPKAVLSEGAELKARFKKLANIL